MLFTISNSTLLHTVRTSPLYTSHPLSASSPPPTAAPPSSHSADTQTSYSPPSRPPAPPISPADSHPHSASAPLPPALPPSWAASSLQTSASASPASSTPRAVSARSGGSAPPMCRRRAAATCSSRLLFGRPPRKPIPTDPATHHRGSRRPHYFRFRRFRRPRQSCPLFANPSRRTPPSVSVQPPPGPPEHSSTVEGLMKQC